MGFIDDELRQQRHEKVAQENELARQQVRDEINAFCNPSYLSQLVKIVKEHATASYMSNGRPVERLGIAAHMLPPPGLTTAIIRDQACTDAVFEAIKRTEPKTVRVELAERADWENSLYRTLVVEFSPPLS